MKLYVKGFVFYVFFARFYRALFDPIDLEEDITPASTRTTLKRDGDEARALTMALKLNQVCSLTRRQMEEIHISSPFCYNLHALW